MRVDAGPAPRETGGGGEPPSFRPGRPLRGIPGPVVSSRPPAPSPRRGAAHATIRRSAREVKVRAERRLGEVLAAMPKNKGTAGRRRPPLGGHSDVPPKPNEPPTLRDLGISKNQYPTDQNACRLKTRRVARQEEPQHGVRWSPSCGSIPLAGATGPPVGKETTREVPEASGAGSEETPSPRPSLCSPRQARRE